MRMADRMVRLFHAGADIATSGRRAPDDASWAARDGTPGRGSRFHAASAAELPPSAPPGLRRRPPAASLTAVGRAVVSGGANGRRSTAEGGEGARVARQPCHRGGVQRGAAAGAEAQQTSRKRRVLGERDQRKPWGGGSPLAASRRAWNP
eukprot:TRINITY_DN896_c0_g1_i7.p2 TRINITY_DN896_c0_g1~~TRINITY_DN896_c0_g1_i7.p2  ORF type:complete len:150 (+),score=7.21 TRINITY_DN896_c0_g1_i7:289-738(+)